MSCYKSYGRENRFDPVTFKKESRGAIHPSKVIVLFALLVIRWKELAPLSLNQLKLILKKAVSIFSRTFFP